MTDAELLQLNASGFIPGPSETEEMFLNRAASVQKRCGQGEQIPRAHLDWVRLQLKEIFDFEPECIPVFYSNRSLAVWQGAASWIEDGKLISVQLREALRKGSYWGYRRDEILAHEAVHAARSAFEEPRTEEFFAYLVSEKWWRRAFGPMIQRPWEVWPFLLGMGTGLFFPLGNFGAAAWVGMGFLRLIRLHRCLRRAGKSLMRVVKDGKKARAILLRLTDREIELLAKGADIAAYAARQECLRWRLIRLAYLAKLSG